MGTPDVIWHRKVLPSGLALRERQHLAMAERQALKPWSGHTRCDLAPQSTSFGTLALRERQHLAMTRTTQHATPPTLHSCAGPWPCSCEGTWMRRPHWLYAVVRRGDSDVCYVQPTITVLAGFTGVGNIEPQKFVSSSLRDFSSQDATTHAGATLTRLDLNQFSAITSGSAQRSAGWRRTGRTMLHRSTSLRLSKFEVVATAENSLEMLLSRTRYRKFDLGPQMAWISSLRKSSRLLHQPRCTGGTR